MGPKPERIPIEKIILVNQNCAFHDTRATALALSEQAEEKSEGEFERRSATAILPFRQTVEAMS
jgi:hypothetical protein